MKCIAIKSSYMDDYDDHRYITKGKVYYLKEYEKNRSLYEFINDRGEHHYAHKETATSYFEFLK